MIVTVVAISESVRYSPFFCAAHGGLEATSGRTGMSRPRCCGRGGFLTVVSYSFPAAPSAKLNN